MYKIDWEDWKQYKKDVQTRKLEQKRKIYNLLESDLKDVKIKISEFVKMYEDEESNSDMMDLFEESLMRIASGEDDPKEIAIQALKKYRGED